MCRVSIVLNLTTAREPTSRRLRLLTLRYKMVILLIHLERHGRLIRQEHGRLMLLWQLNTTEGMLFRPDLRLHAIARGTTSCVGRLGLLDIEELRSRLMER